MIIFRQVKLMFLVFFMVLAGCKKEASKNVQHNEKVHVPNVLIIQADDLGYDDLALHGNPHLETPNLDKLGETSIQFEDFYLQNVCAPSRASLLTGCNYLKTGVTSVHAGRDFMNIDKTTIAEIFKNNGYNTGMWGKWHSGKTNGYFPWDRGFDEAYYACLYNYWDNTGLLNGNTVKTQGFATDVITDMAIDFVSLKRDKPFFAYMSHLAPHNPWRAPDNFIKKYEDKGLSKPMATLYGMIDNLDYNIGRLLDALDENKLTENTIIVFMSDNGPWRKSYRFGLTKREWNMRNPSRLRGSKGENWQNGVKSTLFVKWKNHLEPKKIAHLTKIEDILPTLTSLCNIVLPESLKLDGADVSPVFDGRKVEEEPIFFANHSPKGITKDTIRITPTTPLAKDVKNAFLFKNQQLAIRKKDFKYIQNQGRTRKGLYNIKNDPQELLNLIDSLPTKIQVLEKELKIWYDNILKENSYNMPVFQIGYKNRLFSQIYAASPTRISKGLVNKSHELIGWSKPTDTAVYSIKVHASAKYKVFLIHKMTDYSSVEFSVGTKSKHISSKLTDYGNRDFGTLLEGESAYWEDFDKPETFKKDIIKSEIGVIQLDATDTELHINPIRISSSGGEKRQLIAIQLYKVID